MQYQGKRGFPILRVAVIALILIAAVIPARLAFSLLSLPGVDFLKDPSQSFTIQVRDWEGEPQPLTLDPDGPLWTPLEGIPLHLRDAVVVSEDFNFFHHRGVDWFEVWQAVKQDLRERRFARGASTISQQLAKNLFLSREKTLSRKIHELVLARRLEETLTKERILELYLNVVELGPMVHGVGPASRRYFDKDPAELTLSESTFLAAMLPGPRVYDPYTRLDRVMDRSDRILGIMARAGKIDEVQRQSALAEIPLPGDMDVERAVEMVPDRAEEIRLLHQRPIPVWHPVERGIFVFGEDVPAGEDL